MRFLFLSYYFPPLKSVGAIRAWQWAKHLKLEKHSITVLTTTNGQVLPQETADLTGMEMHEAYTFDYRTLAARLRPNQSSIHFEEGIKKNRWSRLFIRLKNTIPFCFFLDEGGFLYLVNGLFKSIKLVKNQKITHIISSYRPYSDHLIAYFLKRIFKNKIHWTADFRDLHVDPLYHHYYGHRFQCWANRFILKKADLVTTVSQGLAKYLKPFNSKVYVLRNSIDSLEITPSTAISETFNLVYTGSMFGDERDPQLLLAVLAEMMVENTDFKKTFRFKYAGKDVGIWHQYLKQYAEVIPIFENKGEISRTQARLLQAEAHINLLLTTATPEIGGILTGKFNEYLQLRQPILILINGVKDEEFEQIVLETSCGILVYNTQWEADKARLKQFLYHYFEIWKTTGIVEPIVPVEVLQSWTWKAEVNRFTAIIE
ncbi:MAG: hypothetical protein RLZZ628_1113 [Bacteroidota bacterium]|jgi:hypothetical protein